MTRLTFDNNRKQATRDRTLAVVQRCPDLYQLGHLTRDWMELDAYGSKTGKMLAPYLDPARFIGVSREKAVVEHNRQIFEASPHCVFLEAEMGDLVMDRATFRNVGVLVFDGFNTVSNTELGHIIEPLVRFCRFRTSLNGSALLVLNLVIRPNPILSTEAGIEQYHRHLVRFEVPTPADGDVETYRGDDSHFSMYLHRILFTKTPQRVEGATTCEVLTCSY